MADIVVMSESEKERVEALGKAFRTQLQHWLSGVVTYVRHSDGVQRELAMSMLEAAAAVRYAEFSERDAPQADVDAKIQRAAQAAFDAIFAAFTKDGLQLKVGP